MSANWFTPESDEELERAARGEIVGRRYGRVFPCRLSPSQRRTYEAAKINGFVRDTQGNIPAMHCFLLWCEMHEVPFVLVRQSGSAGTITVDVRHIPPYQRMHQIEVRMLARLSRHEHMHRVHFGAYGAFQVWGVPASQLSEFAARAAEIARAGVARFNSEPHPEIGWD